MLHQPLDILFVRRVAEVGSCIWGWMLALPILLGFGLFLVAIYIPYATYSFISGRSFRSLR